MRWYSMCLMFAALIMVTTQDANATHWKLMGKSKSATYYADVDSAKPVSGEIYKSIWTRTAFKKIHSGNGKDYQSLKQLVYIDCNNREMATKSIYAYKNDHFTGSPAFSVTYKDYMLDFSPEPPEKVGYALIQNMCKQ